MRCIIPCLTDSLGLITRQGHLTGVGAVPEPLKVSNKTKPHPDSLESGPSTALDGRPKNYWPEFRRLRNALIWSLLSWSHPNFQSSLHFLSIQPCMHASVDYAGTSKTHLCLRGSLCLPAPCWVSLANEQSTVSIIAHSLPASLRPSNPLSHLRIRPLNLALAVCLIKNTPLAMLRWYQAQVLQIHPSRMTYQSS